MGRLDVDGRFFRQRVEAHLEGGSGLNLQTEGGMQEVVIFAYSPPKEGKVGSVTITPDTGFGVAWINPDGDVVRQWDGKTGWNPVEGPPNFELREGETIRLNGLSGDGTELHIRAVRTG